MIEDKEDIKAAIIYFEKEMKKLINNSNYDDPIVCYYSLAIKGLCEKLGNL